MQDLVGFLQTLFSSKVYSRSNSFSGRWMAMLYTSSALIYNHLIDKCYKFDFINSGLLGFAWVYLYLIVFNFICSGLLRAEQVH
ncbi:hypothetical protein [Flavobacterium sp. 102]|uniref:hypothetical protein n=1 Tax=Flavobacterium sp. 102 TaxID=2135623 RepID=UPI0011C35EAD|nr:hypothetical protein [Flavobacterium sp. 102]